MGLPSVSTSPCDYVVLDVETNGLKSKEDDLLSISLYKPDDEREYDRFLPLDLNRDVFTTGVNGITKSDLKGKRHLAQDEVDELFEGFELDRRTILHYGSLDVRFVRDYFARHGLDGFDRLRFFNFKQLICSTGYSDGSLTKDNLCDFFGIEGVTELHSGIRDCKLEWELFKKLDGRYLLARIISKGQHYGMWRLAALDPNYILPVSYLATFKNLSRIIERPFIKCEAEEVFRFEIAGEDIRRFPTNYSGMVVEHLIDTMLGVTKADNAAFLAENSAKNELLGYMPSYTTFTPMSFNDDGTMTAVREEDKEIEREINAMIDQAQAQLAPLVEFIKDEVFHGGPVTSQELVVNDDLGVLALCDLSNDEAVLEIKTSRCEPERYAEQLYYEGKGRDTYLLGMEWGLIEDAFGAAFTLKRVRTYPGEKPDKRRDKAVKSLSAALEGEQLNVVTYTNSTSPVKIRCMQCGHEWEETYSRIKAGKCVCPVCCPDRVSKRRMRRAIGAPKPQREKMTAAQALAKRAQRYVEKVSGRSNGVIAVDVSSYIGGKDPVQAYCSKCGYTWTSRADHLLARPFCPKCGIGR